jgi:hypothetical protein
MKKLLIVLLAGIFTSCSSIRVIDSWKNEEVLFFKPQKVLVIGMTDNLTARSIFEEKLKNELGKRNINAEESLRVIDAVFTDSKKTEAEIDKMIAGLSEKGFDAVILTAVKGVDAKRDYSRGYYTIDNRWRRFGRYYYSYQDIYYTPGYYNEYKVYHVETSVFNINQADDRSLVWVGAFDLVNPQDIRNTITEYVAAIIKRLEEDLVITKI